MSMCMPMAMSMALSMALSVSMAMLSGAAPRAKKTGVAVHTHARARAPHSVVNSAMSMMQRHASSVRQRR